MPAPLPLPSLETPLLDSLQRVHADYSQAEALLTDLGRVFSETGDPTPLLSELQRIVQRVSALEAHSAGARQAWIAQRGKSPAVDSALARQRTQLERMLSRIQDLEQQARDVRNRLAPQLDSTMTASSGHAAYGRTLERAGRVR